MNERIDFAAIVRKALQSGEWPFGEYVEEIWQGATAAGEEIYEALQIHLGTTYPGGMRYRARVDLDVVWLVMTLRGKGEQSLLEEIFCGVGRSIREMDKAYVAYRAKGHGY